MHTKQVLDYAAFLVVRSFLCIVQALPLGACRGIANRLGSFVWHVLRLRRTVVEENLRTALPHLTERQRDQIALGMWQHLLLMVMEIAHAPRKVHRSNWRKHTSMQQMNAVLRRLIDERPTVLICGHLGNFEMGGYLVALHGFPTHTIARPLDNPYLDNFFREFRESTGQYMLSKQGSGAQVEQVLEQGGTLGLLGDQDAGPSGCWVDFFGKPASTHKGVALFTLSGEAPTAVCATLRKGPLHFEIHSSEVIDPLAKDFRYSTIPEITEWYTSRLESLIQRAPEQYWWVHRRWKGRPEDRKARRLARRKRQAA